jgi:DNA repair protein RadC
MPFPPSSSAQTDFAALLFADAPTLPPVAGSPLRERGTEEADHISSGAGKENLSALAAAFLPVYRVKLVQTDVLPLRERPFLHSPADIAHLLGRHLTGADREHFVVALLTTKNRLIGVHTVSIGDLSSALVHPREVFKAAILANAASVLLAHNHPSGDTMPSPEDLVVTRHLIAAGEVLGIAVLDHVILGERVGGQTQYTSLKEKGYV